MSDNTSNKITDVPAKFSNHAHVCTVHGRVRLTFGESIDQFGKTYHSALIVDEDFATKLAHLILNALSEHNENTLLVNPIALVGAQ